MSTKMDIKTESGDGSVQVTAKNGRVITLKKPDFLAQFRLEEAIPDSSNRYYAMCFPLIYVSAIDGDPVPFPSKKREIEGLVSRLGEDGFEAIKSGIDEHFSQKGDTELAKK
ncbi:MAG: hypothetical protein ACYC0Z_13090 [Acidobacteriaceae bacterium]